MRKHHLSLFATVLALLAGVSTTAIGRGADWPWHSAAKSDNVGFIAVSASYDHAERDVRIEGADGLLDLMSRSLYGSVSCDLTSWLTLAAGAGQSTLKPADSKSYGDGDTLWMAAARLSFWEFPLTEPSYIACRIRFDSSFSYWQYKGKLDDDDADWSETRGTLTVSAERLVENWDQDPTISPYSLVFYAGCIYSKLDGKIHLAATSAAETGKSTLSFSENESFGLIGGIDFLISHNLSIGGDVRAFDGLNHYSHSGNLALHF